VDSRAHHGGDRSRLTTRGLVLSRLLVLPSPVCAGTRTKREVTWRNAERGKANIRKRQDGRWEGTVRLGYRDGKLVRPSVYGLTRGEVQEKLEAVRRDFKKGLWVGGQRQTVEDYLTRWLSDVAQPRLRPRTFDGYKAHVEKSIVPALGRIPLKKLTPQDVQ
jgi:integrase